MSVRSVERTIDLLELLAPPGSALSLTELARGARAPKSTVLTIARTLVGRGVLAVDRETRKYRLGLGLARFNPGGPAAPDLSALAKPHLEALAQDTRETAYLTVPEGDAVYYTCKVDSPEPVRYMAQVGVRRPLHAIASGKLYLAQMSDAEVRAYVRRSGLSRFTPSTIVRTGRLVQELRGIRRRGYAVNEGEFVPDLFGVSAAVTDQAGRMIAAVNVGGPLFRLGRRKSRLAAAVMAAARALAAELRLAGGNVIVDR
jgi:IclR family transcriptional regulator, acetate operon repressor